MDARERIKEMQRRAEAYVETDSLDKVPVILEDVLVEFDAAYKGILGKYPELATFYKTAKWDIDISRKMASALFVVNAIDSGLPNHNKNIPEKWVKVAKEVDDICICDGDVVLTGYGWEDLFLDKTSIIENLRQTYMTEFIDNLPEYMKRVGEFNQHVPIDNKVKVVMKGENMRAAFRNKDVFEKILPRKKIADKMFPEIADTMYLNLSEELWTGDLSEGDMVNEWECYQFITMPEEYREKYVYSI